MFGNWFASKLRAAERALDSGDLDGCARLLAETPDRRDPRAQQLGTRLAAGLLSRARVHAQELRLREALADVETARQFDRSAPDAEALRSRLLDELRDRRLEDQAVRDAYQRASGQVEAGRLESARALVDQIPDRRQREQLREELDLRLNRARELFAQAQQALSAGNIASAAQLWTQAVARHGCDGEGRELAGRIGVAVERAAAGLLNEGSLDRFMLLLDAGELLRAEYPGLTPLLDTRGLLRDLARRLSSRDYVGVHEGLLRVSAIQGGARWVRDALVAASELCDAREKLLASPLGALRHQPEAETQAATRPLPHQRSGRDEERRVETAESGNMLLLVDGAGSFLLSVSGALRIGRAGAGGEVDVALPADVAAHHADILRSGGDYFLVAHGPATVNRRPVTRVLLRDQDRVVLGTQGRFTFHKPSGKSASAVLRLSDRCRLAHDVSRVILLADTCVIGPQPSCHVPTRDTESRVVLFERDGRLHARRIAPDGRQLEKAQALVTNQTCGIGDQRITLAELPRQLA